ncbi:MAG: hypothetical protein ABW360_15970 [Phenylobacterium sp.]
MAAEVHVFTSAAANYLPKVRLLFESLRRLHPEWDLHLALADAMPPADAFAGLPPHEPHQIADLGIPEWRAWAFCHSLMELATAIKPFLLRRLLARPGCKAVIYLDPDVVAFSRLDDVLGAFAGGDILLTPHQTVPEATVHGVIANEICTLQHGVYNLGFVGVAARPEGRAFADWWAERTYRFCRADIPNGVFTDQRWIDLAPGFFEGVRVLRSPRLNVAPWNLSTRRVDGAPPNLTVEGQPLGFFHFSAIDSTPDFGGGSPAVAALAEWYRARAAPLPAEQPWLSGWGFDAFADGEPILVEHRLVYRLRGDLQRAFPDPFADGYRAWFRDHAPAEFPALFDPAAREGEITRLSSALTTGYVDLSL